jgi:hypothetical protein
MDRIIDLSEELDNVMEINNMLVGTFKKVLRVVKTSEHKENFYVITYKDKDYKVVVSGSEIMIQNANKNFAIFDYVFCTAGQITNLIKLIDTIGVNVVVDKEFSINFHHKGYNFKIQDSYTNCYLCDDCSSNIVPLMENVTSGHFGYNSEKRQYERLVYLSKTVVCLSPHILNKSKSMADMINFLLQPLDVVVDKAITNSIRSFTSSFDNICCSSEKTSTGDHISIQYIDKIISDWLRKYTKEDELSFMELERIHYYLVDIANAIEHNFNIDENSIQFYYDYDIAVTQSDHYADYCSVLNELNNSFKKKRQEIKDSIRYQISVYNLIRGVQYDPDMCNKFADMWNLTKWQFIEKYHDIEEKYVKAVLSLYDMSVVDREAMLLENNIFYVEPEVEVEVTSSDE